MFIIHHVHMYVCHRIRDTRVFSRNSGCGQMKFKLGQFKGRRCKTSLQSSLPLPAAALSATTFDARFPSSNPGNRPPPNAPSSDANKRPTNTPVAPCNSSINAKLISGQRRKHKYGNRPKPTIADRCWCNHCFILCSSTRTIRGAMND